MTEQEAIESLKCYRAQSGTSYPEEIEKAIKALEEIQQYRAIGTPEECRNSVLDIPKAYNKAIDDFTELLKGNLVQKYANARLEQQYVALQVTDWCDELTGQLKVVMEDEID